MIAFTAASELNCSRLRAGQCSPNTISQEHWLHYCEPCSISTGRAIYWTLGISLLQPQSHSRPLKSFINVASQPGQACLNLWENPKPASPATNGRGLHLLCSISHTALPRALPAHHTEPHREVVAATANPLQGSRTPSVDKLSDCGREKACKASQTLYPTFAGRFVLVGCLRLCKISVGKYGIVVGGEQNPQGPLGGKACVRWPIKEISHLLIRK